MYRAESASIGGATIVCNSKQWYTQDGYIYTRGLEPDVPRGFVCSEEEMVIFHFVLSLNSVAAVLYSKQYYN